MFIFLDESGDLGFDWSKQGTSLYFTVTILICDDKRVTDKISKAVKRTLRTKINHKNSKRSKKELKGSGTTLAIKEYFNTKLPDEGWKIYSVTLNKKNVYQHLQTKQGKKKLYNFLASFLIEKVSFKKLQGDSVNFVVDRCKNKSEIKDFNGYIENQLEARLPLDTRLYITHESSEDNLCLQAVDLFCWGIALKCTGDRKWYNCFKKKVVFDTMYLK
jgi:hypothetical protein